jgi:hypothetical protein
VNSLFFRRRHPVCLSLAVLAATVGAGNGGRAASDLAWKSDTIVLAADRGTKTVEALLQFKNNSSHPVRVVDVKPSCGCISTEMANEVFAPAETGEIKAVFTVGSKSGREEKYIEISTDEADTAPYRINLLVTVPRWLEYDAADLSWPASSPAPEKFIRLWSPLDRPLELVAINYDPRRLKVKVLGGMKPQKSFLVSVQPVSTAQSMQEAIAVRMKFNELERDILIYGQVK